MLKSLLLLFMFAIPINYGDGYPDNGPLTCQSGVATFGSDNGVLTACDQAGNKFILTQPSQLPTSFSCTKAAIVKGKLIASGCTFQ